MPIASLVLMGPSGLDLLEAGKSDSSLVGIMEDMGGVSARAFPQSPQEDAMLKVATFVVNHEIWWKDAEMLRDYHRNPGPKAYLELFENRLKTWAYHIQSGNQETDWYSALNRMARLVHLEPGKLYR